MLPSMKSSEALQKKDQIQIQSYETDSDGKKQPKTSSINKNLKTEKQKTKVVNFFKLYKYGSKIDFLLIFLGALLSIATGCGLPFFAIVAGDMIDAFDEINEQITNKTSKARDQFLYIGTGTFIAAWLSVVVWMKIGQRISLKCRKLYLKSLMKQNINFFDTIKKQEFIETMENDFLAFREALGFKVGTFMFIAASLIAGGRNAISTGWLLSVIMVSTLPLLGLSGILYTFFVQLKKTKLLEQYQLAQSRSKEVIYNLQKIKRLNGQKHEYSIYERYSKFLRNKIIVYSSLVGLGAGWFSLVQFGVYALAFWFGSHCVQGTNPCPSDGQNDKYTPGAVIVIFFAFYVRLDSMQQILPTLRKIYGGMQAAYRIYDIIDKEIELQNFESLNQIEVQVKTNCGKIQFRNITLYDKNDLTKKLLDDVSFIVDCKKLAFYGRQIEKQAILRLIMRFDDPDEGVILLDDIDIRKQSLDKLRKNIGFLDFQNGLFDTSIINNLNAQNSVSNHDMFQIFCNLDIEDKIKIYQNQLNSIVGYQGNQLDYDLRRRLLISRALLRKPYIFIIKELINYQDQLEQLNLFNKLGQLSTSTNYFIYFGTNSKILKSVDKIIILNFGRIQKQAFLNNKLELFQNLLSSQAKSLSKSIVNYSYEQQIIHSNSYSQKKSPQSIQIECEQNNFKLYENKIFKRTYTYIKSNKKFYILGLIASFFSGLLYPVFTIFLSDILLETFKFKNQPQETSFIRENIAKPVLIIVYIGISSFIINFLESMIFSFISERMTQKVRQQEYDKILYLPINWFNSSPLTTPFKAHASLKQNPILMNSISTMLFPILFKNIISAITGLIIAFIFEWRTGLLGVIVLPMMMSSGLLLMKYFYENDVETKNIYKLSSSVVTQMLFNIKYIQVQNMEALIETLYKDKLKSCQDASMVRSHIVGFRFGLSQFLIFVSFTIMFYFGSLILNSNPNSVTVLSLFSSIFSVIWPGWTSGSNFFRSPNLKNTKIVAANNFSIIDSIDQRDIQFRQNSKNRTTKILGNIRFQNINITCSKQKIQFENVSFKVNAKQKVAILGNNEAFKIIINMITRITRITGNNQKIIIDENNINDYELGYIRSNIAIIDENPLVFKGTIKQNIQYDCSGKNQIQILKVCQAANLTDLIEGFQSLQNTERLSVPIQQKQKPIYQGLQTVLPQNTQKLSISQRQRIAIARLLLRDPKIVIIQDDVKNLSYSFDQRVRKALDRLSYQRTVMYCPHNEQDLKNADKFVVFEGNKCIEWDKQSHSNQQNKQFIQKLVNKFYLN